MDLDIDPVSDKMFRMELPNPVGIDVGVSNIAVLSDGTVYENTHGYHKEIDEFRKTGEKLSRTLTNTKQYRKTKSRLNHKYRRMVSRRKDRVV